MSPPKRRKALAANQSPDSVDVADDLISLLPEAANRRALRRGLARVADQASRRGDIETAALAVWLLTDSGAA